MIYRYYKTTTFGIIRAKHSMTHALKNKTPLANRIKPHLKLQNNIIKHVYLVFILNLNFN